MSMSLSKKKKPSTAIACSLLLFHLLLTPSNNSADAFQWRNEPPRRRPLAPIADTCREQRRNALPPSRGRAGTVLAAKTGSASSKKRRRRKRKRASDLSAPPPSPPAAATAVEQQPQPQPQTQTQTQTQPQAARATALQLFAQERSAFEDPAPPSPPGVAAGDRTAAEAASRPPLEDLFDSREFLPRRRAREEAEAVTPSTAVPARRKIKRSDIKAYEQLLEMDPTADEDARYFEDEGIDFVSALLGDVEPGVGDESDDSGNRSGNATRKKTSFLGIGSGPLQLGHFIGALGVILMAFVEYPGFPLTNLPDPLRGALQGGLGTIYLVNTVLAVLSALSAPSRNQSSLLWGVKTFAVGAIAYDQLMQIPTPEELRERERREEDLATRRQGRRGRRQK